MDRIRAPPSRLSRFRCQEGGKVEEGEKLSTLGETAKKREAQDYGRILSLLLSVKQGNEGKKHLRHEYIP